MSSSVPTHAIQELLETLVQLEAPTFHEEERTNFIYDWLKERIPAPVGRDAIGNVWLDLSHGADRVYLFDAHIDTIFPRGVVSLRKEAGIWHAPGILDNTLACCLLMTWAAGQSVSPSKPLPFLVSFSVREEGKGDLGGIREIVRQFAPRIREAWVFDLGLHRASWQAIGSLRYKITWSGPGGHSWNNFGRPNPIHDAARWVARLEQSFPWAPGLNSYNVGRIAGGIGINVIPGQVELELDVRSLNRSFLEEFSHWLDREIQMDRNESSESVFSVERIGERPAGQSPDHERLTAILEAVHQQLALPLTYDNYSTNCNALIAAGIPAVVTGLGIGAGIHTEKEYLEIDSVHSGYQKLEAIAQRLAEIPE